VPAKDYSGTPLSQKLGARPGTGVVVVFTTSREDLERRFAGPKATLDPADGLWIAWPKASEHESDLTFETVQERWLGEQATRAPRAASRARQLGSLTNRGMWTGVLRRARSKVSPIRARDAGFTMSSPRTAALASSRPTAGGRR
jgi:hypothetical protein